MAYRLFPLLVGVLLGACTASPVGPDPQSAFEAAAAQAMRPALPREPVPLPPRNPSAWLQSEIEAMSHTQLARWVLPPAEAADIVATALLRGTTPRIGGIAFYRQPRRAGYPGLCELQGYEAWMRVPNESSLTYAQHLNPPLQPFQYQPLQRWKVVGSTLASPATDCAGVPPTGHWFEAPSAAAAHRAVALIERVQTRSGRNRLICRQMRYEEGRQEPVFPDCPDPRALLARLTPDLIKSVRAADCTIAPSPRGCIGIEYHDPAAPGSHSIYLVTVPDADRPDYVQITQAMLPPH